MAPPVAFGAVSFSGFSVTPTTTQAAGHPNVKIVQSFSSSPASDDARDVTVRLPPGLAGDPHAATRCSAGAFAADTCAASSKVGAVAVQTQVDALGVTTAAPGDVYNLPPAGGEPARLGLIVRPPPVALVTFSKIRLEAPVKVGPETGYGLETTFANQPRTANSSIGPLAIRIAGINLTLFGRVGSKAFITNPSSCRPVTALARVTSYDSAAVGTRTAPYRATGCAGVPFSPKLTGTVGRKGANGNDDLVPLTTVIALPAGNAALRVARVILPSGVTPNLPALNGACPAALLAQARCPAASRIGSAKGVSPLLDRPLTGPVYLVASGGLLPKLVVQLSGQVSVTLEGALALANGRSQTTFTGSPDLPLSRFELSIKGGPGGLLKATGNLCKSSTKTVVDASLTAYSDRVRTLKSSLDRGGCKPPKPRATATLKKGVLVLRIRAGDTTRLRRLRAVLPRSLTVPARRLKARAAKRLSRKSVKLRGRTLRVTLPRKGARALRLVARGVLLKGGASRRLALKLTAVDTKRHTTRLRVRFRARR
jgi:hypothetical protein